jgi:YD repeat-containing protein
LATRPQAGGTETIATPAPLPTWVNTTPAYLPSNRFTQSRLNESGGHTLLEQSRSVRPVLAQKLDRWGNVVERADARDADWKTTYRYDARDQLVEQTTADGAVTRLYYDAAGHGMGTLDARGNMTWQRLDANGQVTEEHRPDGGVVRHRYDALGNKVRTINTLGQATDYAYDRLGQLTEVKHAAVQNYTVTYQPDPSFKKRSRAPRCMNSRSLRLLSALWPHRPKTSKSHRDMRTKPSASHYSGRDGDYQRVMTTLRTNRRADASRSSFAKSNCTTEASHLAPLSLPVLANPSNSPTGTTCMSIDARFSSKRRIAEAESPVKKSVPLFLTCPHRDSTLQTSLTASAAFRTST